MIILIMKLQIDPAMLKQLQEASSFFPEIIDIRPMKDLRGFLTSTLSN